MSPEIPVASQAPQPSAFLDTWGTPIGLWLTKFMLVYTFSLIPAIMPPLVQAFNSSISYIQGMLVLVCLVAASFSPTSENLSRRFGRKLIYTISLGLFAIGLLMTALSPTIANFSISFVLVCGLSGAALVTTPGALLEQIYTDKAEQYAILALVLAGVAGGLTGGILGGWVASVWSWRWAFGLGLLLIPVILWLIRHVPNTIPQRSAPLDWFGGLLSFLGLGLTLLGVCLGGEYGWWVPKKILKLGGLVLTPFGVSFVPALIASGLIFFGIFLFWQRQQSTRGKAALMRVGLLRRKSFLIGVGVATLYTLINGGMQFNLYQFIPVVLELNPLRTALTVLPYTLAMLVVVTASVWLKPRLSLPPRFVLQSGLILLCLGIGYLYSQISATMKSANFILPLVIMGIGAGLFLSEIDELTFSVAQQDEKTEASGIYNPAQNLGESLGRAILGTTLITIGSVKVVDTIIAQLGQTVSPTTRQQAIYLLGQLTQTFPQEERRQLLTNSLPAPIQPHLVTIVHGSAAGAMKITLLVTLAFGLICLAVSFYLPKYAYRRT